MNALQKLRTYRWHIGLIRRPIQDVVHSYRDQEIVWLRIEPEPSLAADPFGVIREGRLHIYFESMPYGNHKGRIAHVEVASDGRPSRAQTVLEQPYHLSYPYMFEFRDDLYMIPESARAKRVTLFRCAEFPAKWEPVTDILTGVAYVDSTVTQHDGRWWLFAASGVRRDELQVWWAMDPLGPWTPHRRNPVKTGLSSTRPAGTPFVRDGVLFRPAMDYTTVIRGHRIVVNRVVELSPEEFREEPVVTIEPPADSYCSVRRHTLASVGDFTLVDGERGTYSPNPVRLFWKLHASLSGRRKRVS